MRHVLYTYFNEHKYKVSSVGLSCAIECVSSPLEVCCLMARCTAFCSEIFGDSRRLNFDIYRGFSHRGFIQSIFKNTVSFG